MDRVIINDLSRAIVVDPARMQDLAARAVGELVRWFGAEQWRCMVGSPGSGAAILGPTELAKPVVSGLGIAAAGGGTQIALQPGWLAQYSTTYPDTVPAYQSAMRIGLNLSTTATAITGAAPNGVVLVEGRVVDRVTAQETRAVFDPITQTFGPQLLDVVQERQIEIQTVVGSLATVPAFSGGTWVPLWMFLLDGSGLWDGRVIYDFRRLPYEAFQQMQREASAAVVARGHAVCTSRHLRSCYAPGSTPNARFAGNVRAQVADFSFAYCVAGSGGGFSDGEAAYIDAGLTPAGGVLEYVYLVPVKANGVTATARVMFLGAQGEQSGLLVRSNVEPSSDWITNSGDITLPSPWGAYDPIPAGQAVCVGAVSPIAADPVNRLVWFAQDSAGQCLVNGQADPFAYATIATGALGTGLVSIGTISFTGAVPQNAKTVKLALAMQIVGSGGEAAGFSLIPAGGTGSDTVAGALLSAGAPLNYREIEVPARFVDGGVTSYTARLDVFAALTNFSLDVKVIGWTL